MVMYTLTEKGLEDASVATSKLGVFFIVQYLYHERLWILCLAQQYCRYVLEVA